MKDNRIHRLRLAVMAFVVLTAGMVCPVQAAADKTTMEDVKKQVSQATETIKDYSADQRDAAINKAKEIMDSLDAKIDKLRSSMDDRWGKMDEDARRKARAALDELKRRREQTAKSYRALKRSSAGAWEHMKQGFSDSYADLHDAWQKAKKEFADGK